MDQAAPQAERQDAILDAAFRAFAGYGYRRVAMEDIARGAGMSRSALYLHFRSKEDIFRSLLVRYFDECLAGMTAALAEPAAGEAALMRAFAAKDGKLMEVVLTSPHGRELLDAGFEVGAEIAAKAEARMAGVLAGWIAAQPRGAVLGSPKTVAETVIAGLKGLKTSAPGVEAYRAGQAVMARMLSLALGA